MNTLDQNNQELIDRTAKYVYLKVHHEPSGHDWFHVERVWKLAKTLQKEEGGNSLVIELAALLHNIMEHSYPLYLDGKPLLALHGMMDIIQIDEPLRSEVIRAIDDSKFKADETKSPITIEGRILQDANWLDAIGAIGIARAFASGGFIGRPIHDPSVLVRTHMDKLEYQKTKKEGTSFNYLFEKSLRVAEMLNTETGRKIARTRVAFIQSFVEEFKKEWDGVDVIVENKTSTII